MEKICSCCGELKNIVNSFFRLCLQCNITRLNKNKPPKVNLYQQKKTEPKNTLKIDHKIKIGNTPHKASDKIRLDEEFYEKCFNLSNHKCEECNSQLPTNFRDENGKVIAKWRYSHIVPKSIAPELRLNTDNINHLCLKCHDFWENKEKVNMKIFAKNLVLFPEYLEKWIIKDN